ncbi:GbsR/MarR family transcriptional regulator [Thioclava sp. SK-1]|uniref:GbsR/MarR family transcriptional regulator n=1 Tax=Thioclava sp. SK-1 TaxID=1889770 RepID=UPI00159F15E5|nr:MarR family transcriptional regulator [Thioclava sp. SK-1]
MSAPDFSIILSDLAPGFGISRPAALCFGAIWRAAQSPSAEELVTILGISRSNVSTALKELRHLGLVQSARTPGSRRDYFFADPDPWALLRQLIITRQQRDIAVLSARLTALAQSEDDGRVQPLADVAQTANSWMAGLGALAPADLAKLMQDAPRPRKKKKLK